MNYGPRIITDGLVVCMDAANIQSYPESGTNWTDMVSKTNATLYNTPTFETSSTPTFNFDGSNQYASISNVYNFSTSNQLTATVWCKSNTENWNQTGFVISRRDQFIIHPSSGSKTCQWYINVSGWVSRNYAPSSISDNFHEYTLSYNSGSLSAYFDGKLKSNYVSPNKNLTSDTGVIEIAKDDGWTRYGNCKIPYVSLYNRELTATEIYNNYIAIRGRFNL